MLSRVAAAVRQSGTRGYLTVTWNNPREYANQPAEKERVEGVIRDQARRYGIDPDVEGEYSVEVKTVVRSPAHAGGTNPSESNHFVVRFYQRQSDGNWHKVMNTNLVPASSSWHIDV
jgi:hypothetical protein